MPDGALAPPAGAAAFGSGRLSRHRDFAAGGRSSVYAREGMVATQHPLAAAAGLDVLRSGGNAVDAAVAAMLVLAVCDPAQVGLGGDAFVLYYPSGSDRPLAIDGAGVAPAAATRAWYAANGFTAMPKVGPHAVSVPGAVATFARLVAEHGTRPLGSLMAPAIRYAEDGFPVSPRVALDWANAAEKLAADPGTAATFLPGGRPPRAGEVFRNPRLSHSLAAIAADGPAAFYEGPIAEDLVATLAAAGGLHTLDDFAGYRVRPVTPIHADYRGATLYQCPPSGQGLTVLLILNILAALDLPATDPLDPDRLHLLFEAAKLAYAERDGRIADPAFAAVPVERLLSPAHAAALAARIDPARAADLAPEPVPGDTGYVSAVDRDGNVVSLISSLFRDFGAAVTGASSGILLQNRASGFVLDETHPNVVAPGKRPMHTIAPAMAFRDGRPILSFGVIGGDFQPTGQAMILAAILDFGLDPQAAIDLPRGFATEGVLRLEATMPASVREALARRGHRVEIAPLPLGGAQAIAIDSATGVVCGGSDCRLDGCALGY